MLTFPVRRPCGGAPSVSYFEGKRSFNRPCRGQPTAFDPRPVDDHVVGVSSPKRFHYFSLTGSFSNLTNKDGRCYTFDDRGAGYARGEGLGVLVLKRLEQAIADGDAIHAIVMESGSNHDGKTGGIFLPNSDAQESLARRVYANAGLDPRETLYVEAHGTGTAAGKLQSSLNMRSITD